MLLLAWNSVWFWVCGLGYLPFDALRLFGLTWWVLGEMEDDYKRSPSYYSVLGVSSDSSNEEIRRAYRKLAMVSGSAAFLLSYGFDFVANWSLGLLSLELCGSGIDVSLVALFAAMAPRQVDKISFSVGSSQVQIPANTRGLFRYAVVTLEPLSSCYSLSYQMTNYSMLFFCVFHWDSSVR